MSKFRRAVICTWASAAYKSRVFDPFSGSVGHKDHKKINTSVKIRKEAERKKRPVTDHIVMKKRRVR